MAGVKGKSGRVSTPEARIARREAARLGGLATAGRKPIEKPEDGEFEVSGWIDRKDQLACLLLERKILAADVDVEAAEAKRDQERGKLLTLEQVRARDERHAEVFRRALETANDLMAKHVPADRILAAQEGVREWIATTLEQVSEAVKQ